MTTLKYRDEITAWLTQFPEVLWDRCTFGRWDDGRQWMFAFGWIAREDGARDFVEVGFADDRLYTTSTSSAKYSLDFHRRIFGDDDGHHNCHRIASVLPDVMQAIGP